MVSTMGTLFDTWSSNAGFPFSPLMFTKTGFRDVSNDFVTSEGTVTDSSVYGFSVALFVVLFVVTAC